MPVGSTGLPANMVAAEQAQMTRALSLLQERAMNQVEAGRSQDRGKEAVSELIQDTRRVEGATIQGESRGAHSSSLQEEEKKEEKSGPPEKPPDPAGRGQNLDVRI